MRIPRGSLLARSVKLGSAAPRGRSLVDLDWLRDPSGRQQPHDSIRARNGNLYYWEGIKSRQMAAIGGREWTRTIDLTDVNRAL